MQQFATIKISYGILCIKFDMFITDFLFSEYIYVIILLCMFDETIINNAIAIICIHTFVTVHECF